MTLVQILDFCHNLAFWATFYADILFINIDSVLFAACQNLSILHSNDNLHNSGHPHDAMALNMPASTHSQSSTSSKLWRFNLPHNLSFSVRQISLSEAVAKKAAPYHTRPLQQLPTAEEVHLTRRPGKDPSNIRRIWIWGERNSCTTAITRAIAKNFALDCEGPLGTTGTDEACVIGGLPWKHDFMRRADLSKSAETLHLLVSL
jgi:hypothetical protein